MSADQSEGRTSDLEQYVAMRCAGSFMIGPDGKMLIFPFTWRKAYVVERVSTWHRLRVINALLMPFSAVAAGLLGFLLLTLGVEALVVAALMASAVLLSGLVVLGVAFWVSATFERSDEVLTREEGRRVMESIERRRLLVTFLFGLLGIGVLGASAVAGLFEQPAASKLFGLTAACVLVYSGRRLAHHRSYVGDRRTQ